LEIGYQLLVKSRIDLSGFAASSIPDRWALMAARCRSPLVSASLQEAEDYIDSNEYLPSAVVLMT